MATKGAGKGKGKPEGAKGAKRSRTYSDRERAEALAALDAEGGVISHAAKRTGVPQKTLAEWAAGRVQPEVLGEKEEVKKGLADRLEELAHKLLDNLMARAASELSPTVPLRDVATSLGIVCDKLEKLRPAGDAGGPAAGAKPGQDMTPEERRESAAALLEQARENLKRVV